MSTETKLEIWVTFRRGLLQNPISIGVLIVGYEPRKFRTFQAISPPIMRHSWPSWLPGGESTFRTPKQVIKINASVLRTISGKGRSVGGPRLGRNDKLKLFFSAVFSPGCRWRSPAVQDGSQVSLRRRLLRAWMLLVETKFWRKVARRYRFVWWIIELLDEGNYWKYCCFRSIKFLGRTFKFV